MYWRGSWLYQYRASGTGKLNNRGLYCRTIRTNTVRTKPALQVDLTWYIALKSINDDKLKAAGSWKSYIRVNIFRTHCNILIYHRFLIFEQDVSATVKFVFCQLDKPPLDHHYCHQFISTIKLSKLFNYYKNIIR